MPSNSGHYDAALLAEAPKATKEQLQEGYTTDILQPSRRKPTAAQQQVPQQAAYSDLEAGAKEGYAKSAPLPFWKTQKGIIIIAIAAIIIVGAVVGGAVGGTRKKKHNDNSQIVIPGGTNGATTTPATPPTTSSGPLGGISIPGAATQTTTPAATTTPPAPSLPNLPIPGTNQTPPQGNGANGANGANGGNTANGANGANGGTKVVANQPIIALPPIFQNGR